MNKFEQNDIFYSRIETHPECEFYIYDRKIYYNNKQGNKIITGSGDYQDSGYVDLYELNFYRSNDVTPRVYPFVTKEGSLTSFKTISLTDFNSDFSYGDILTGSYPLKATIFRERYAENQTRKYINSLRNTLNYYKYLSLHYDYDLKSSQELTLIDIPSIFYGSQINKGTVDLKFYITGTLIGRLQDINKNGELIQTEPINSNGSGSIAGVILYNEGCIILTGSWDLSSGSHTEPYIPGELALGPQWIHFASTGSTGLNENLPSSSFDIKFEGVNYVSVINMLAHAPKGEYNHSNNPTYVKYNTYNKIMTGSIFYVEKDDLEIKNIIKSSYNIPTASFKKQTYISKIAIYDEEKNLIGIAKLAQPIRKKENDDFTFKLKLDI